MPAPHRLQPVAVIDRLLKEPHRFGFFQAVRLLERWLQSDGAPRPQAAGERLQFRSSLSLSFPASEIESLTVEGEPGQRPTRVTLVPAAIGLLGAHGALPLHYTELLAEREQLRRDSSARAFIDIFLHRSALLFYQAWRKHRMAVQAEAGRRQRFLSQVLALAGLGQAGLRDRLGAAAGGVPDQALAHAAGHLQRRPVSAAGLRQLLQGYFGIGVQVQQFIGRWFELPPEHRSHLGLGEGMASGVLGAGAVIGERVWQRDLRVRLTLGPLDRTAFRRFLPGAAGATALRELLSLLTGCSLEYEVQLVLRADQVDGCSLDDRSPARLGWDTFLSPQHNTQDRHDAGYDLLALA